MKSRGATIYKLETCNLNRVVQNGFHAKWRPYMSDYTYTPTIQLGGDATNYRLLTTDGIRVEPFNGKDVLVIDKEVLEGGTD